MSYLGVNVTKGLGVYSCMIKKSSIKHLVKISDLAGFLFYI